ncbi:MAG: E3 binding domain-containing protein, partial [Simkaniaceae bacterium]|nr:E3 binding domain-containing protein [Simkaniaceae bacterium]
MPFTLTMPKLSPTMEEGMIVKWHKKEGDEVKADELLFEVATDKATVEYNALDGGFLRKIIVAENSSAQVNQAVAIFTEQKDESIDGYQPTGEAPAAVEQGEEAPADQPAEAPTEKPQVIAPLTGPKFVPAPPLTDYKFKFPEKGTNSKIASPLAKKLAKEQGIDLSAVKGTGPGGRIVKKDLELATPGTPMVSFGSSGVPSDLPGTYDEEVMT